MSANEYAGVAERLQAGQLDHRTDPALIMRLLGYEAAPHKRLGHACRPIGETHWQSLPRFNSADDFELWVLNKRAGKLDDIGRNEAHDEGTGGYYVSYSDPEHGNDYGEGKRLGTAMWAAFVRLVGKVEDED